MRWGIRFFVVAALIVNGRMAGWSWPVSVITAPLFVFVAVAIGLRINLILDIRRGLSRPEWRALGGMAFDARRGIKIDFDRTALRWTKGTEAKVLSAYATILLNLLIARELGPRPTSDQIDQLVARRSPDWVYVLRRDPAVLDQLVRAACLYKSDGFPPPTWDNCRGLAAAVGNIGSAPIRRSLRRSVIDQYARATAVPAT